MKQILLFFLGGLFLLGAAQAQSFQLFLDQLDVLDASEKVAAIDSFMNEHADGLPYISGSEATFIYRGNANSVNVAGDFNGWSSAPDVMGVVEDTDLWYLTKTFELNARLDYKFVLNGSSWILDPQNPHTISGGFGPNSELAMPEYVQPWEIESYPGVATGTMESFSFDSEYFSDNFQVQVYLPPSYEDNPGVYYPSLYVQDGSEAISLASTDHILDNLIDEGSISEVIGIFVRPNNRNAEYAFEDRTKYVQFFVEELVPYVDSIYRTIQEPSKRAVMGASFGGNISGLISFNHPDIFGNAGLHSAAFWPNNFEVLNLFASSSPKPIRIASIWGSYEGPSISDAMPIFSDVLDTLEYDFIDAVYPEGHSWGLWRATTDDFLKFFFPPGLVNNEAVNPPLPNLEIFSNPFSDNIQVSFNLEASKDLTLSILDVSGKTIKVLHHETKAMGDYHLNYSLPDLPGGIYFLRMKLGEQQVVRKIVKD